MNIYKIVFCKGYSFFLRYGLGTIATAANHMHFFVALLVGVNIVSVLTLLLIVAAGEKIASKVLVSGISWVIVFVLAYMYVEIFFMWKQQYISIRKLFYKNPRISGRKGTLLSVSFVVGSYLFFLTLAVYLGREKLFK